MTGTAPVTRPDLLAAMQPSETATRVSIGDLLQRIGDQSFAPMILMVGLILVSPLSGIPGTPTIGALVVLLCVGQALLGRDHLWLPVFLMRRSVKASGLRKGLAWLDRPAAWIDRHTHSRFPLLTQAPLRQMAYAVIGLIAVTWPVLELLPFVTSFGAGALSLIAFGLMARDGAYLLWGYGVTALLTLAAAGVTMGML